jgi:hypothetical protein
VLFPRVTRHFGADVGLRAHQRIRSGSKLSRARSPDLRAERAIPKLHGIVVNRPAQTHPFIANAIPLQRTVVMEGCGSHATGEWVERRKSRRMGAIRQFQFHEWTDLAGQVKHSLIGF